MTNIYKDRSGIELKQGDYVRDAEKSLYRVGQDAEERFYLRNVGDETKIIIDDIKYTWDMLSIEKVNIQVVG